MHRYDEQEHKKNKAANVCFHFCDAKLCADPDFVFNDMILHAKTITLFFYLRFRRERAKSLVKTNMA